MVLTFGCFVCAVLMVIRTEVLWTSLRLLSRRRSMSSSDGGSTSCLWSVGT